MKLQKAKRVMWGLFGAMGVSMILAGLLGSMPLALLSAILLLAFIRYSFSHWRCPHCGEYLGRVGKGIQLNSQLKLPLGRGIFRQTRQIFTGINVFVC